MERNSVRAAYIHKAEHLDERKLMLQWWADFLDANREKGITPFDYAKINREQVTGGTYQKQADTQFKLQSLSSIFVHYDDTLYSY